MLCESCKHEQATVHLTEIIGNQKQEIHLCEECARSKGAVKANVSIAALLGNIMDTELRSDELVMPDAICSVCGMTFAEFRKGGRLGCCEDFDVFCRGLLPLLERIHGATQHCGKLPKKVGEQVAKEKEILQLRQALAQAVEKEEYETAAEIRDKIKHLSRPESTLHNTS